MDITVDGPGTGDGFELFCDGETDISDASRPIKEEEAAACADAGIEFIELEGRLRRHLRAHQRRTTTRRVPQLRRPLRADRARSPRASTTGPTPQTLAAELGSDTELPRREPRHHRPGRGVGHLRQLHRDRLRRHRRGPARGGQDHRGPGRDDPARLPGVGRRQRHHPGHRGLDGSLGWVGFAFAEEAGDQVKEIAVADEPGGECVAPTRRDHRRRQYPLSRSLYIYVNAAKAESNAAVAAYVDFYLDEASTEFVEEAGYVPLPDDQVAADPADAGTTGPPAPQAGDECVTRPSSGPADLEPAPSAPVTTRPLRATPWPRPWRPHARRPARQPRAACAPKRIVRACSSLPPRCSVVISALIVVLAGRGGLDLRHRGRRGHAAGATGWFPRRGLFDIKTLFVGIAHRHRHRHGWSPCPLGLGAADLPRPSTPGRGCGGC